MHIHSSMSVMPSSVSAVFFVVILCKVCNEAMNSYEK